MAESRDTKPRGWADAAIELIHLIQHVGDRGHVTSFVVAAISLSILVFVWRAPADTLRYALPSIVKFLSEGNRALGLSVVLNVGLLYLLHSQTRHYGESSAAKNEYIRSLEQQLDPNRPETINPSRKLPDGSSPTRKES